MYSAEYAARILEKRGQRLLVGLVGDGLMEVYSPCDRSEGERESEIKTDLKGQ